MAGVMVAMSAAVRSAQMMWAALALVTTSLSPSTNAPSVKVEGPAVSTAMMD